MIELILEGDFVFTDCRIEHCRILRILGNSDHGRSPSAEPVCELGGALLNRCHSAVLGLFTNIIRLLLQLFAVVIDPSHGILLGTSLFVYGFIIRISDHVGNFRTPTNKLVRTVANSRIANCRYIEFRNLCPIGKVIFRRPYFMYTVTELNSIRPCTALRGVSCGIYHIAPHSIACANRSHPLVEIVIAFRSPLIRAVINGAYDIIVVEFIRIPHAAVFH